MNATAVTEGAQVSWRDRGLRLALGVLIAGVVQLGGASTFGWWQAETADPDAPVENPEDSDEFVDLPKLESLKRPTFEDLMSGPAVDWILLNGDRVLQVEPVVPRPKTVEKINELIKKATPRGAESEEAKKKRLAMFQLPVTLLEGDEREYTLHIKYIRGIQHFEDLMLEEIDRLLEANQIRKAYELLVALEERDADWPGIGPRRERMLFVDAQGKLASGQIEHALALVESLHGRNPNFPGLSEFFGKVMDRLLEVSVESQDFRRARFFLRRGSKTYAGHRVLTDWTGKLTQQARDLLTRAQASEGAGNRREAALLVERASVIWPSLQELPTPFARMAGRWQRLRVGVVTLPATGANAAALLAPPANLRRSQLLTSPLFQPFRVDDRMVRFRSPYCSNWEPLDLGHTVRLTLYPRRLPYDSRPLLTAFELSSVLANRVMPEGAAYDARLSAMIEKIEVDGPFDLSIHFAKVPLRPEVLLSLPLDGGTVAADEAQEGAVATVPSTFPFVLESTSEEQDVYLRAYPEPEGLGEYHLSEIVERRYPDYEHALQALFRGEVWLLPRVPLSVFRQVEKRTEFFVQAYGLPASHFLLLNHRQPALRSRSLRRALVYAVDRRRILEDVFLGEPAGELGRLTSAPWSTRSYAYSPFVQPHLFDSSLAYSLAHTAERELDTTLPELHMLCPAEPEVVEAARRIIADWKRVGVRARLTVIGKNDPVPDPQGTDWDVIYRVGAVAEPAAELSALLTRSTETSVEAYSHLPAWLRRDLLELDRAGDWNVSTQILHRLHRQIWAEVELVPLWELDERFVCRKQVRNIPERPAHPYQQIERWRLEPFFPREATP